MLSFKTAMKGEGVPRKESDVKREKSLRKTKEASVYMHKFDLVKVYSMLFTRSCLHQYSFFFFKFVFRKETFRT